MQLSPKQLAELYERRIIVLLETAPQSNEYRQVQFTYQQYSRINEHIQKMFTKEKSYTEVRTDVHEIALPDVRSFI